MIGDFVDLVSGWDDVERKLRAFPKGQFGPDTIEVHTVLSRGGLDKLIDVLRENDRIDGIQIFPRGIPNPDVFSTASRSADAGRGAATTAPEANACPGGRVTSAAKRERERERQDPRLGWSSSTRPCAAT